MQKLENDRWAASCGADLYATAVRWSLLTLKALAEDCNVEHWTSQVSSRCPPAF